MVLLVGSRMPTPEKNKRGNSRHIQSQKSELHKPFVADNNFPQAQYEYLFDEQDPLKILRGWSAFS
jgi:hypothetical protein